jgi:hypothetical protein
VQAPFIVQMPDQLGTNSGAVSLQVGASDPDGLTLSYGASGLPGGLTIDTSTGLISGTLSSSASASSPYSVTVTASNGTLSSSDTFTWTVTTGGVTVTSPGDQNNSEGDSVSLQIAATSAGTVTGYSASGLPAGLSINTSSGLISGTVSSTAAEGGNGGIYLVTVTASDDQGNSGGVQFTWDVSDASNTSQSFTLSNPGSQTNAEGDQVSLQLQTSDPSVPLVFTARGLPVGLHIDANSGLISGVVDYSAAEIASGHYSVFVAANDGNGTTLSESFTWSITDTPRAPWINSPGDQSNDVGDSVSVQLVAGDPDGQTLTFAASGLPAGLSVNSTTGVISGTITAADGFYTVTATVSTASGAINNASTTFTWQVTTATVTLGINDTIDHSDDVALVNQPAIPVLVTLTNASPGVHHVTITIPSGLSTVDQPSLLMSPGGSTTIWLTPLAPSATEDDVTLLAQVDGTAAGQANETNELVTFPSDLRAADTPADMVDRIPDVNPTESYILLSTPLLHSGEKLFLQCTGQSADTGTVIFIGPDGQEGSELIVTQSMTYQVVGMTQTQPTADGQAGNASKLQLMVQAGFGQQFMLNAFAVAPIPTATTFKFKEFIKADNNNKWAWGILYSYTFTSDGGALRGVYTSEQMKQVKAEGGLSKMNLNTTQGNWQSAASGQGVDKVAIGQKPGPP